MKCIACGNDAKNVYPLTPARCKAYGIPEQPGVICINCISDIEMSGDWTGKGMTWVKAQKAAR